MTTIHLRCDLANMLSRAAARIHPDLDPDGATRAGVIQVVEHIEQLRAGAVSVGEFARFYMLGADPYAVATPVSIDAGAPEPSFPPCDPEEACGCPSCNDKVEVAA